MSLEIKSIARRAREVEAESDESAVAHKRELVARLCRLLGETSAERNSGADASAPMQTPELPADLAPRARETLSRLLAGDAEKEIAARLGISRNTVHVYVKNLYRHFDVNSRGELLAKFVNGGPLSPV